MQGALPLQSLWELYFKGHDCKMYSIHVHVHLNYNFPNVVQGGEINVFDAEKQLLANDLLDPNNETFMLHSKSCMYPSPISLGLTNTSPNHNITFSIALTMLVEVDKEGIMDFDTSRDLSHP
ncbi:unnamed protein product [Sphagnum compactum]